MDIISDTTDVLKILPASAEELCTALFRNSPAGIYITRNGKFIYTNIEFRRMTGFNQDELNGKDYQRLINPRYRQKPKQNVALLFADEGDSSHEFKITTKDGRMKWIAERITYFKYGGTWLTLGHWLNITDRHSMEKAWQEAERRFQSAFEDLATGLTVISTDGIFLKANKSFYDMVGYDEKEILESHFDELLHPDDRLSSGDLMQLFVSLERPDEPVQRRLLCRDGRTIWVAMNISLIGDSEEDPSYFIVYFQNITEQKRIESGLKEEYGLYQSIINNSIEPVLITDLDFNITHVSQKLISLLGCDNSYDLLGRRLSNLVEPNSRNAIEQELSTIVQQGKPAIITCQLMKKDSTRLPAELTLNWINNDSGLPQCIMCSLLEISTPAVPDPAKANIHSGHIMTLENSSAALMLMGEDTKIEAVNAVFEKMAGYTRDEIEGKMSWVEFIAEEDKGRLKKYHFLRRIDPDSAPDVFEFKFIDKQGNSREITAILNRIEGINKTTAVLLDHSNFRKSEHDLLRLSSAADSFTDQMPVLFYSQDYDAKVVKINQKLADLTGSLAGEIIGKEVDTFFPDYQTEMKTIDNRVLESGLPEKDIISSFTTQTGNRVIKWEKIPRFNTNGLVIGIINYGIDITEQQQYKKECEEAQIIYQQLAEEQTLKSLSRFERSIDSTIEAMVKIVEIRDPYTAGHQMRVARLAAAIAGEMNLTEDQIKCVHIAGRIHDIGKIYVPSEILMKPGPLNKGERHIIEMHAQGSHDILKPIDFFGQVTGIVLQHHERINGSGYPQGLKSDEIMLEARIIAVADVVEAMTSFRTYRPAYNIETALAEIEQNSGILYDSDIVDACTRLFRDKGFCLNNDCR